MTNGSAGDASTSLNNSMIFYTLSATWFVLLRHTRDQTQRFLEMLETAIGTTRSEYWILSCKVEQNPTILDLLALFTHLQAVSDIERAVQNLLQFVAVDFIGIIISAAICYKVSRICLLLLLLLLLYFFCHCGVNWNHHLCRLCLTSLLVVFVCCNCFVCVFVVFVILMDIEIRLLASTSSKPWATFKRNTGWCLLFHRCLLLQSISCNLALISHPVSNCAL